MPKPIYLRFLLLALLFTFSNALKAQLKCSVQHYSTEDGLSHERVTCMLKDREGFMWFGTWDGLNRFDGHNFTTYKSYAGDKSGLKSNRIDQMVEDNQGHLWIKANDKQIYRFDKQTGEFTPVTAVLNSGKVKYTFERTMKLKDGSLWLITDSRGIFLVANNNHKQFHLTRFSEQEKGNFRIPSDKINFFHEDSKGELWLGTQDGITCLVKHGASFEVKNIPGLSVISKMDYLSATEDVRRNRMLFTTDSGYLIGYDLQTDQLLCRRLAGEHASLNAACVVHSGKVIYCSTSAGKLLELDAKNWTILNTVAIDERPIHRIYEDSKGIIWIEPHKRGIIKYDPQGRSIKHFVQQNDANFENGPAYYKVFEDGRGNVWANMKGCGFGYYNAKDDAIDYFYNAPSINDHYFSNVVNYEYYDPAGILWLSTDDRGVDKIVFHDNEFHRKELIQHSAIKSFNEVRSVYYDREGRLWIGTKQGKIYITKNGKPINSLFSTGVPADAIGQVYTMLEDKEGIIWLGTKSEGLYRAVPLNKERSRYNVENLTSKALAGGNAVYSLAEDNEGRIWVGCYDSGITMITGKQGNLQFFNLKNSFRNYPAELYHKVRNVTFDARGYLWVATTDGLVIGDVRHKNAGQFAFRTFSKIAGDNESLGNNDVQFIFRDSRNTMWLATSGGGLSMATNDEPFKSLKFKTYTIRDGLPNDYVLSCIEDDRHKLWLATQKGLSEFDKRTRRFRNFDSYDGLPKNGLSEGRSIKLPDGELMFGTVGGYLYFHPDSIVDHKIVANMALTDFRVNNKNISANMGGRPILTTDINETKQLHLNYDQNLIDIGYNVLDYRSDSKNIYAYRLKGFDAGWVTDNKNQRRAIYSHLPPGTYEFQVKSLNDNVYFNKPEKGLLITIAPPPWKSWWAWSGYLLLAVLIITLIRRTVVTMFKLRESISVEKQLTDLKLQFFTNISHELRTPLTLILNPIEEIATREQLSDEGKEYARIVHKNAKRMVSFVNQLLDLRKIESGKAILQVSNVEVIEFVRHVADFFKELALEKQVTLKIESNVSELFAWVDREKLDVVVYNILANALKFTCSGTTVTVFINADIANHKFSIRISDKGIGVAPDKLKDIFELYESKQPVDNDQKGTGIGLALAKEIVELHRGEIKAFNNADGGLSVMMTLSLGRGYLANLNHQFVDSTPGDHHSTIYCNEWESQLKPGNRPADDCGLPLILLVEDNYDLRKFLVMQLRADYRVEEAENGRIGWEKAVKLNPDMILSDVMMPEMDGIELLDKIKNNTQTSHIPIILLSAQSAVETQIRGLSYGADYYLTKPFSNKMVIVLIENLLKKRKQVLENLIDGQRTLNLSPGEIVITPKDETFLKKIVEIVENGMVNPEFNIESVAESIGMSRSSFYKKFKSLTNLTPVEFLREMRLKRSLQFFEAGESDIANVAYAVGFSDPKYFSVCFKKRFDSTPSEHLKSIKVNTQPAV